MNDTSTRTLVMGTRGSPLALAQSRQVARALEAAHPGLRVEERVIRTTGDKQQGQPLPVIGGKGVFTLEIEAALHAHEIDFAVHSLKDLPPQRPDALCIAATPRRASADDVCVLRAELRAASLPTPVSENGSHLRVVSHYRQWPFLPQGARVGTSSLRRRAQLLHFRSDLQVQDIRGNIDTRLCKLEDGGFDAIVLAAAGLQRLGVNDAGEYAPLQSLGKHAFIPAPGQGALAIEARCVDAAVIELLRALDDEATRHEVDAERAAMRALDAGCTTPLGARAVANSENGMLSMLAVVLSTDGQQRIFVAESGDATEATALGEHIAKELLARGARALLSTHQ